jgi:hypothetical protein
MYQKTKRRELPPTACWYKEPVLPPALLTAALLTTTLFTAALLTAALLATALLAAALFFTLAPLTFALFSLAILLSALLSGAAGFARLVWISLCIHNAFLLLRISCLGRSHLATRPFLIKSAWQAVWTETHNQTGGWLPYQAKPYCTRHHMIWWRRAVVCG